MSRVLTKWNLGLNWIILFRSVPICTYKHIWWMDHTSCNCGLFISTNTTEVQGHGLLTKCPHGGRRCTHAQCRWRQIQFRLLPTNAKWLWAVPLWSSSPGYERRSVAESLWRSVEAFGLVAVFRCPESAGSLQAAAAGRPRELTLRLHRNTLSRWNQLPGDGWGTLYSVSPRWWQRVNCYIRFIMLQNMLSMAKRRWRKQYFVWRKVVVGELSRGA